MFAPLGSGEDFEYVDCLLRNLIIDVDPCLQKERQCQYEVYKKQFSSNPFSDSTIEAGNRLVNTMTKEMGFEEVITSTDLTHNSRKSWKTIRSLSNDTTVNFSISNDYQPSCTITYQWQRQHGQSKGPYTTPSRRGRYFKGVPFSEEEYRKGITTLKNNKAVGTYDILMEQLQILGPSSHK